MFYETDNILIIKCFRLYLYFYEIPHYSYRRSGLMKLFKMFHKNQMFWIVLFSTFWFRFNFDDYICLIDRSDSRSRLCIFLNSCQLAKKNSKKNNRFNTRYGFLLGLRKKNSRKATSGADLANIFIQYF